MSTIVYHGGRHYRVEPITHADVHAAYMRWEARERSTPDTDRMLTEWLALKQAYKAGHRKIVPLVKLGGES